MKRDEALAVLSALEMNRVMGPDDVGNYTREITPPKIIEAIVIMQRTINEMVEKSCTAPLGMPR